MRLGSIGLVLLLVAPVAGCAKNQPRYSLVESRPTRVLDALTVEPSVVWTTERVGSTERWTIDGATLESLRFFASVADDAPLATSAGDDPRRPRFHKGMGDADLIDLIARSLYPGTARPAEPGAFRLGGVAGFRFDMRYTTSTGLERRALVVGAVVNDRLQVIVYDAVALYYYARYLPEVERLLATVRFE